MGGQNSESVSRPGKFVFMKECHKVRLHEGFRNVFVKSFAEELNFRIWVSHCGNGNCWDILVARGVMIARKVKYVKP